MTVILVFSIDIVYLYISFLVILLSFIKSMLAFVQNIGKVDIYVVLGQLVRPLLLSLFILYLIYRNVTANAYDLIVFEVIISLLIFTLSLVFILRYFSINTMSSLPHKIFYSQIIPLGILSSLLVTFNKTDVLIMSRFLENYTVGVLFFALKT